MLGLNAVGELRRAEVRLLISAAGCGAGGGVYYAYGALIAGYGSGPSLNGPGGGGPLI
ncbi:hypothetical protein KIMH_11900 [Bombiscardovia apis]|uniref:Uncharacterized protein n=1 Tax=Bombiscardovia apis TaxID=2932182 RepID=A0ABN6SGG9_9BIFI|nr:hypothetical protein KIMH_11900 [Bombiscardovia apis]